MTQTSCKQLPTTLTTTFHQWVQCDMLTARFSGALWITMPSLIYRMGLIVNCDSDSHRMKGKIFSERLPWKHINNLFWI